MTSSTRIKESRRVGFLLESTTRVVKLSFTKAFKNLGINITPEQWVIIDTLYQQGDLTQNELAKAAYKNDPTVSRIIDKLVGKNFVCRNADTEDRRKITISLTKRGKKTAEKCYPEVHKLRELSWNNLSDKDFDSLQRILEKVFANSEGYLKEV